MEILFLESDEVIEIHRDQIERYGGHPGIRDIDLLHSALAMPSAGIDEGYLHQDIYEMAAAYLFHIIRNHPFVDGNKRTGAVAAVVFLLINGIELNADEESFEALVRAVAQGTVLKADAAEFIRERN
jgi:death-on-curing protein